MRTRAHAPTRQLAHTCAHAHSRARLDARRWLICVSRCLELCGAKRGVDYSDADFGRFFRRVYQHYGCPDGYVLLPDALPFVQWATREGHAPPPPTCHRKQHNLVIRIGGIGPMALAFNWAM